MNINVSFFENRFKIEKRDKKYFQGIITKTVRHAAELLQLDSQVDFIVYPLAHSQSIRGRLISPELVVLLFPPEYLIRSFVNESFLKSTLYHETHHIVREDYRYKKGRWEATLINSIFMEGLAITFEMNCVQGFVSGHSNYKPEILNMFLPMVREEMNKPFYDYREWFDQFCLGYKIGKYFVDLILKRYPYLNSITLARTSPEELLDLLYNSGINLK